MTFRERMAIGVAESRAKSTKTAKGEDGAAPRKRGRPPKPKPEPTPRATRPPPAPEEPKKKPVPRLVRDLDLADDRPRARARLVPEAEPFAARLPRMPGGALAHFSVVDERGDVIALAETMPSGRRVLEESDRGVAVVRNADRVVVARRSSVPDQLAPASLSYRMLWHLARSRAPVGKRDLARVLDERLDVVHDAIAGAHRLGLVAASGRMAAPDLVITRRGRLAIGAPPAVEESPFGSDDLE